MPRRLMLDCPPSTEEETSDEDTVLGGRSWSTSGRASRSILLTSSSSSEEEEGASSSGGNTNVTVRITETETVVRPGPPAQQQSGISATSRHHRVYYRERRPGPASLTRHREYLVSRPHQAASAVVEPTPRVTESPGPSGSGPSSNSRASLPTSHSLVISRNPSNGPPSGGGGSGSGTSSAQPQGNRPVSLAQPTQSPDDELLEILRRATETCEQQQRDLNLARRAAESVAASYRALLSSTSTSDNSASGGGGSAAGRTGTAAVAGIIRTENAQALVAVASSSMSMDQEPGPAPDGASMIPIEFLQTLLEDELGCSICKEIFIEATVLDCGHTFCHHCITQWMNRSNSNISTYLGIIHGVMCPECRSRSRKHSKHVSLNNFIDKIHGHLTDEVKTQREQLIRDRAAAPPLPPTTVETRRSAGDNVEMMMESMRRLRERYDAINSFNNVTAATTSQSFSGTFRFSPASIGNNPGTSVSSSGAPSVAVARLSINRPSDHDHDYRRRDDQHPPSWSPRVRAVLEAEEESRARDQLLRTHSVQEALRTITATTNTAPRNTNQAGQSWSRPLVETSSVSTSSSPGGGGLWESYSNTARGASSISAVQVQERNNYSPTSASHAGPSTSGFSGGSSRTLARAGPSSRSRSIVRGSTREMRVDGSNGSRLPLQVARRGRRLSSYVVNSRRSGTDGFVLSLSRTRSRE